jgi:cyclophilin family peptidyl-prolyl cis-trans isomerase
MMVGGLVVVAAIAVVLAGVLREDEPKAVDAGAPSTLPTLPASQPATERPVPTSAAAGASITGDTPCPKADGSSSRTTSFAKPPPMCITPGKPYMAEVRTSKGTFSISLDSEAAPQTVNNFVVLARYHFYDGVTFHRIVPGFVVQGGDPRGTGAGGPGYRFPDELPKAGSYRIGSVAMANSGANTNGSQFFIITGEQGVTLPPQYSLFGTVSAGMEVVKAIEAAGTRQPAEVVSIVNVTIKES